MREHNFLLILVWLLLLSVTFNIIPLTTTPDKNNGEFTIIEQDNGSTQNNPFEVQPKINFPVSKISADSEWTIMVYIAGDNDLEAFAIQEFH